jgi:hypothetical protein
MTSKPGVAFAESIALRSEPAPALSVFVTTYTDEILSGVAGAAHLAVEETARISWLCVDEAAGLFSALFPDFPMTG